MHRGRLLTLTCLGLAALDGCGRVVGLDEYDEVSLVSGLAVFDAYRFQSGAASFSVDAAQGVLANDLGAAPSVIPRSITTRRGGRADFAADGSFTYRPPGEPGVFFGDDDLEYTLRSGRREDIGRVRVTVNPRALDMAVIPSSVGWGYAIAGSANDLVGGSPFSLARAGDVDGDGKEDVLLGSVLDDDQSGGRAYIAFGKEDGAPLLLGGAPGQQSTTLQSTVGDRLGFWFLSDAGDVNGDGLDDVILTAPALAAVVTDPPRFPPRAYVVFGSREPLQLALNELLGGSERGFVIEGPLRDDGVSELFAWAASGAGDFNGDGFADVIVTAPLSSHEDLPERGAAYVVFGRAAPENVQIPAAQGAIVEQPGVLVIVGADAGSSVGVAAAAAGDTNGDGLDDIVLSVAPAEGEAAQANAAAHIVYGTREAGPLRLGDIAEAGRGVTIVSAAPGERAGFPIAGVGDVNGDGLDDMAVSALGRRLEASPPPEPDADGPTFLDGPGVVYVVFGREDAGAVSLADIEAEQGGGFAILGNPSRVGAGASVSGGDVNGDGLGDLLLGTQPAREQSGAYVVFGKADTANVPLARVELGEPGGLSFFDIAPTAGGSSLVSGAAVATGVDLNADGLDDLVLGAVGYNPSSAGGAALALFGWDMTGAVGLRGPALVGTSDDDTLEVPDTPVLGFRGGHGLDTLRLTGSGRTLDLTRVDTRSESLEVVDVRGSGPNTVILHDASLRRIPASRPALPYELAKTLVVLGDGDDTLYFDLAEYAQVGTNQGRLVYAREGRYYGLELSPGMRVTWPPP